MIEIRLDRRYDIDEFAVVLYIENTKTNRVISTRYNVSEGRVSSSMVESVLKYLERIGEIPT